MLRWEWIWAQTVLDSNPVFSALKFCDPLVLVFSSLKWGQYNPPHGGAVRIIINVKGSNVLCTLIVVVINLPSTTT